MTASSSSAKDNSHDRLLRIARQEAMTSLLLGADVLPRTRHGKPVHTGLADVGQASTVESKPAAQQPASIPQMNTAPSSTRAVADASHASTTSSSSGANVMTSTEATARADGAIPTAAPQPASPDMVDASDKQTALQALLARYEREFPHEVIDTPHTKIVWGEGHCDADVMFIGEAPGADEDRTGRPFIGRAGQKLTEIIEAMGLVREVVYITNILKVRPPNNRTPLRHEVEATWPFLAEQIRIIQPRAIVTLGGPSTKLILSTDEGITRLRGIWAAYRDPECDFEVPVMPTFHPAFLLRQYTRENRQKVWSDMLAVLDQLGLPRPGAADKR